MLAASSVAALLLAGCSTTEPEPALNGATKEYFSESAYGVKASPRVAVAGETVPRTAGRYKLGDAYKVKGRWYRPELDDDYRKVGAASWYGSAFDGRLTANGEVYDMTRLTAAHPTMPLPSYARVTNLKNGNSVIVRVNDRGPFEKNRIIDLSSRAAELLDYRHSGVAKVEVDYVGPAPLDVHDDRFLMASYRPGGGLPDPSDGLPTGVMVAMNGPTPSSTADTTSRAFANQPGLQSTGLTLPATGPIIPDRPEDIALDGTQAVPMLLSYADRRVRAATEAFSSVLGPAAMTPDDVVRSWKRANAAPREAPAGNGYIALGTWHARDGAVREMRQLSGYGKPVMEVSQAGGDALYSLALYPDGRYGLDAMLEAAWNAGASDAFAVRD